MYFLYFKLFLAHSCINYSCGNIEDLTICAQNTSLNPNQLTLNAQGCSSTCNQTLLEAFFHEGGVNYTCNEPAEPDEAYTLTINEMVPCPVRQNTSDYNYTMADNSNTTCTDLCYYENGTNSSCLCGYDGLFYCQPNISSGIFSDFWDICTANNNQIDNKTMILWNYWQQHFVEMMTAPYCADSFFPGIAVPDLDYLIDTFALQILIKVAIMLTIA